jgi:hypothetical protein
MSAGRMQMVSHWPLASRQRTGMMASAPATFQRMPDCLNRRPRIVFGLIFEIPGFAAFEQLMRTEGPPEAMKHDGVRPETLLILSEG